MMAHLRIKESLESLARTAYQIIERGRENGSLAPSEQEYFRWRLQGEPKYSEKGVELPSARSEITARPSWAMATAFVAQQEVPQTLEFQAAASALREIAEIGPQAELYLHHFVFTVAKQAFESPAGVMRQSYQNTVNRFLEDLEGLPFEAGAEVKLDGFTLESESIELGPNVILRRPRREDFEEEVPYFGPGRNPGLSLDRSVSAIATVRCHGTAPRDAQLAVQKLIVLLRLFTVTSARYLSYRLFGHSIMHSVGGQVTSSDRDAVHERAHIRTSDEPRLLRFWLTLGPVTPDSFCRMSADRWDYRDVAYERYSAALISPVSFEERVASAVMALEALLLEEQQELAYRLRFRAAKVLGLLGEPSLQVRDAIRDAYNVRSTFAHGGRLSAGYRQALETRYQQAGGLAHVILNMVRKAILVSLLITRSKKDVISLIDDALIERGREGELAQLLSPVNRNCIAAD